MTNVKFASDYVISVLPMFPHGNHFTQSLAELHGDPLPAVTVVFIQQ